MNYRSNNNNLEQFQVELNREDNKEGDNFLFPHYEFMIIIHNKLIWVNHIFREKAYVYEATCFIIGFVLFLFPLTFFIYSSYVQFTIQNIVQGNIRLSPNILLPIISNYILMIYIIGAFILTLLDVLLKPNFKNWNLRTIGSLFQYFFLVICVKSFLSSLKQILIKFDLFISIEFPNYILHDRNNVFNALINAYRDIQMNIENNNHNMLYTLLYPFKTFTLFYFIRIGLFYNNHSFSQALICKSLLLTFYYSKTNFISDDGDISLTTIENFFKFITLTLSCYLFYILECIHKKKIESNKSNKNLLITLNGIIAFGIIIMIIGCLKIIKYDINRLIDQIESTGNLIRIGIGFVLIGNCYYIGCILLNFIFYPIEKQYFVYRNRKYDKHIRVAKCVQYDESPYNR